MKKLITLTFALMLTVSMGFAQQTNNSATATTNGSHNDTDIDQDGMYNTAEVTQTGNSNDAMINQGTLDDEIQSNYDEAYVTQTGNGNSANLSSRDGYESDESVVYNVNQQGNYNSARARAFNAPAEGDLDQSGSHNSIDLVQHTSDNGMFAKISQSGSHNSANVKQVQGADHSHLDARFSGSYNSMEVTQTGGDWQKYDLEVNGSSNTITGTQGAHDADQFATLNGNGNNIDFYQGRSSDAGLSVSGDYNDIDLNQNGESNRVFDVNPWSEDGIVVAGSHNDIDVTQNSNMNEATVDISGSFNSTTISQGGNEVNNVAQ